MERMTSREVAASLGVSVWLVRWWVLTRTIPGRFIGGVWVVNELDVERFLDDHSNR